MNRQVARLVVLSLVAFTIPAAADDSGDFVVRLGQDTTSVEHYTRSASRIEVDQVGRAPRVLQRHFVYEYANGSLTRLSLVVTPPGAATPSQTIDGAYAGDSLRLQIRNANVPVQNLTVALPPGALVVAGSSPWAGYESQIMMLVQSKADSVRGTMYLLGAGTSDWLSLHRIGRDSVEIWNGHQDRFRAAIDKKGRILGVTPISGTAKFSAQRVPALDLKTLASGFAAREASGAGLGMLSPRDSVVTTAGGASLWIDYGRPGKRGRAIYGGVVPYGEVWRTGANAATQFRTDKALDFSGVVVPAGFYTLWTVPSPSGWKLIINSETGQWGTARKAENDLYTIDMQTSTLPAVAERFTITVEASPTGGTLNLDWDTTRASAVFTVKP